MGRWPSSWCARSNRPPDPISNGSAIKSACSARSRVPSSSRKSASTSSPSFAGDTRSMSSCLSTPGSWSWPARPWPGVCAPPFLTSTFRDARRPCRTGPYGSGVRGLRACAPHQGKRRVRRRPPHPRGPLPRRGCPPRAVSRAAMSQSQARGDSASARAGDGRPRLQDHPGVQLDRTDAGATTGRMPSARTPALAAVPCPSEPSAPSSTRSRE